MKRVWIGLPCVREEDSGHYVRFDEVRALLERCLPHIQWCVGFADVPTQADIQLRDEIKAIVEQK